MKLLFRARPRRWPVPALLILGALVGLPAIATLRAQTEGEGAAQTGAKPAIPSPDMLDEAKTSPPLSVAVGARGPVASLPDFPNLEETVRKREKELAAREQRVAEAERRLEAQKLEIQQKLVELQAATKKLQEIYVAADTARLKRIKKLVPAYEGMTPQTAAAALEGLDNQQALTMLEMMEAKKASKILDNMKPEKAVELSKELHKLVPKAAGP